MPKGQRATLKQQRFARAYVVEGNATQAVFQAGYNVKDRNSAATVGAENLSKPKVIAEIQSWQDYLEAQIMPSLQVVTELSQKSDDGRIRLAASRDLLNRAGVGKQNQQPPHVAVVFGSMNEEQMLEKLAALTARNTAKNSQKIIDVSHNIHCATQEKEGVEGSDGASPE